MRLLPCTDTHCSLYWSSSPGSSTLPTYDDSLRVILQPQGHRQRVPSILSVLRLDRHFIVVDHPTRAILSWQPSLLRQPPSLQRRADGTRVPDDLLPGDTSNDRRARQPPGSRAHRRTRHGLPATEQRVLLTPDAVTHPAAHVDLR